MQHLIATFKKYSLKISGFTLVFAFVKFNSFSAALLLSNFMEELAGFGLFEYALALGLILAQSLNIGLEGAYPFFNLRLKRAGYRSIFYFHGIIVCSLVLFFLGGQYIELLNISDKYFLTSLIAGIIALQVLMSVILKSHEQIYPAVILEGGLFLILNLYNLYLYYTGKKGDFQEIKLVFTIYLVGLLAFYVFRFLKTKADFSWDKYREIIRFGYPILLSAFLIVALTGTARIIIEIFLGLEEVAIYGLYFRFAIITVLLHQVVNIAFFKTLYQSDTKTLDKWFAGFLIFLLGVSLLVYPLVPKFLIPYFQLMASTWAEAKLLFMILNFQMLFWIGVALFENIIYREQLSPKMNIYLFVLLGLMISIVIGVNQLGILSTVSITLINTLILFLAFEAQSFLLAKKGLHFPKARLIGRVLVIALLLSHVLLF